MGANRKLQIEIDRTLKKVAEGIDTFDEIWEKVSHSQAIVDLFETPNRMINLLRVLIYSLTRTYLHASSPKFSLPDVLHHTAFIAGIRDRSGLTEREV